MRQAHGEDARDFSDDRFWRKIRRVGNRLSFDVLERALQLYYLLKKPDLPPVIRLSILSSLAYFVMPIDLVSDFLPVAGYSDDLGLMISTLATAALYLDKDIRRKARFTAEKWTGMSHDPKLASEDVVVDPERAPPRSDEV